MEGDALTRGGEVLARVFEEVMEIDLNLVDSF
jgi:hypothetical protein